MLTDKCDGATTTAAETLTRAVNTMLEMGPDEGQLDSRTWVYVRTVMEVIVELGKSLDVPPAVGLKLVHDGMEVLAAEMLKGAMARMMGSDGFDGR
jgi:hypothetical protein